GVAGVSAHRTWKSIVSTQRAGTVLTAEQAAPLQDRHDVSREPVEAAGEVRRHHVEAVGRALPEPSGDAIGDLLGGANGRPVPAPEPTPATVPRWSGPGVRSGRTLPIPRRAR